MSFISDLLVEISSFRIRIGNKLNALKTLIDGKANIDGSNIPYDTKWSHLKAGGLGDYYYTDTGLGSNFTRVMVWDQGGWFWTNKSGMQTWLGLDDKVDIADQLDYYQYFQAGLTSSGLLFKQMDGSDFSAASSTGRLYDVKLTTRATGSQTGARYVLFNDGSGWQVEELTPPSSSGFTARLRINSNGLPELYNNQSNTAYGAHVNVTRYRTDAGKGGEWKRLLSINYEHLFNAPALTDNNYLESIITTNGTTAGTVYTFKRVGFSDLTLQLTAASASFSGVVTIGDQTFEGIKTFLKSPKVPNAVNSDEAVNKSQLDAVGNAIPTDVVRTTTNQDVNGNKRFTSLKVLQSHTSSSTSSGWHRIATVTGRGYYEISINYTGGNFTPTSYVIKGFISWSNGANQNDLQVDSLGVGSYIFGARLVRENSENFIEVYFNTTPTGNVNLSVSNLKGNGNAVVSFMSFTPVPALITGSLWAESIFGNIHRGTQFTFVRSFNFLTLDFGSSQDWFQAFNERVTQFNITGTGSTNVYTFSILLANGVQKQATLQTSATHFTINASGVLQLNAAIAQKINDAATEAWVTQQIANISIPNGQLTVNTTSDLVGGFVYLPNGNVTTTIGLSTAILNNIADGVTAYSYGDHAAQGYLKIADLNGYATQSWVNSKNFATQSQIITPNNGSFVVQGVGALTGAGSTSADSATNSIATLDLTASTKSQIAQGVSAYNEIPELRDGVMYHHINNHTNIPIETKKTIINVEQGAIGLNVSVDNGRYDGDELAINGCGEWAIELVGEVQDACGNMGSIGITMSKRFWWVEAMGRWVEA